MSERVVVTAALPYANGSIHIGHLVEYIMTDVYVRALKLAGDDAVYICADDTHGTPIELSATKAGVTPVEWVERIHAEHIADFQSFGIGFDSYYSTNSLESRAWVHEIYGKLKDGGYVSKKPLEQLYDEQAKRFLPDRFVKGECPKCGAKDQYGDVCEVCGSTYSPEELKSPYSTITGTKPVMKTSEHLFVDLARFKDFLAEWVATPGRLQPETRRFVEEWINGGLKEWCISRDAPYFGFPIPDQPEKFFYVWLDAPIGYISSTENWARSVGKPELVNEVWREGKARIEHVIGKDIVYFHTLFWPAMLHAAGLTVPRRVRVHGMLTVNGVKMSKSRGTFINAKTFKQFVDPLYLRYFFASKTGPSAEDIDLSVDELVNRVNAELVNNLANLVARSVAFVNDKLGGRYGRIRPEAAAHVELVKQKVAEAEAAYRAFDLATATKIAVELATLGNKLFQDGEPWKLVKTDPEAARDLVTLSLNLARAATVLMAPVIPAFAEKVYPMLGLEGAPRSFREATALDLSDRPIGPAGIVLARVEKKQLEAMIEASKAEHPQPAAPAVDPGTAPTIETKALRPPEPAQGAKAEKKAAKAAPKAEAEPPKEITYDQFSMVDLRVGHILEAETVEGSDKLLRLTIDLGEAKPRNVFAGIREAYAPADVKGKKVAVVANLAPRKMRFGTSEGMVLAGGPGGKDIWICTLADHAVPGERIR
ncbi:methionine--tRNA ligase [Myxococcota bacterium]|nr:methionine--tRNA ligase [Myxococcota bacterium]